jgi:vitamin K-dependent gamma-carboxylase-like protein
LSLALLRVVVAGLMPLAPGFREGARIATWAPERWIAPEGLGWFVRHVPINGTLATVAQLIVAFAALCAIAGVRARLCFAVLTVLGFYLFAVAQLAGHVWHDNHLLWFCALLAASPCADVLAVDATRPLATEGRAYAVPLLVVRLLLGAIYFFPGLHKLLTSGLAWALSDNLRNQLYWKWAEHGVVSGLRFDAYPWLLKTGGLFVLAFELSFGFLVLFRRTRTAAVVAGLVFHFLSYLVFRLLFASLWLCFVALVDWRPLARRLFPGAGRKPADPPGAVSLRQLAPSIAVGVLLLAGALVQGARGQMRSYPFSCYPTFEWIAAPDMPDLMIVAAEPGALGREVEHARDASGLRTQRQWAEVWSLAGVTAAVDPRRLRAYWAAAAQSPHSGARRVTFYRVYRSVVPGERRRITRPPVQLLELNE